MERSAPMNASILSGSLFAPRELHIPDGFLSPGVYILCWAITVFAVGLAMRRTGRDDGGQVDRRIQRIGRRCLDEQPPSVHRAGHGGVQPSCHERSSAAAPAACRRTWRRSSIQYCCRMPPMSTPTYHAPRMIKYF